MKVVILDYSDSSITILEIPDRENYTETLDVESYICEHTDFRLGDVNWMTLPDNTLNINLK